MNNTGNIIIKANHRLGVSAELARRDMRRKSSLLGAMMVEQGDADGLLCGTFGYYDFTLKLYPPCHR